MAKHAGASQSVIAQNVANADTPGFRAREVTPFETAFSASGRLEQHATRSGHLSGANDASLKFQTQFSDAEPSPNGNSVSIEEEMLKAVGVSRNHNQALAIYRHGMTVLRTSLGR